MKLFHCSNAKVDDYLIPQVGNDSKTAGKAVIYLSDFTHHLHAVNYKIDTYLYEVEIQEDDPNLSIDKDFFQGMEAINSLSFEGKCSGEENVKQTIWFCYSKRAKIVNRSVWNEEKNRYEEDLTWKKETLK